MVIDLLAKLVRKDPTIKRHFLKTLSWRVVGSVDTAILGWIITGQIATGIKIGGVEMFTKMILYFFHERMWLRIPTGRPSRAFIAQRIKEENVGHLFLSKGAITRKEREQLNENKSFTIWLTGLSASGKSTIAAELDKWFFARKIRSYVIDGDNTRLGINSDLSFSNEDRSENIRRVAEICKLFNDAGTIVVASFISPFEKDRLMARQVIGKDNFIETFVDASVATCRLRDPKGLYELADSGKIKNFTAVNSPYEAPGAPDIHVNTNNAAIADSVKDITAYLASHHFTTEFRNKIQAARS